MASQKPVPSIVHGFAERAPMHKPVAFQGCCCFSAEPAWLLSTLFIRKVFYELVKWKCWPLTCLKFYPANQTRNFFLSGQSTPGWASEDSLYINVSVVVICVVLHLDLKPFYPIQSSEKASHLLCLVVSLGVRGLGRVVVRSDRDGPV